MIQSLSNPSKYPDKPDKIKIIQTHISTVFISKKLVYKIKKPVNFGFLDFTTLDKRKFYCNREIELNKRLSPDIYLKVVPVVKISNDYFFERSGDVVDYAVVMKKIDESNLLKNIIKSNNISFEAINSIVKKLYDFHETYSANYNMAIENSSIEMLKFTTDENFSQTEKYIGITIDKDTYKDLKFFTDNFYVKEKELFEKRIYENRIKECHGDLHLEHIGINENTPFFLDCIEFNERFRIIDVANEIAFLAMDLDFNGYKNLSSQFVNLYREISKDSDIYKLVNFYKVYRAYVRGKVTSFLIDDKAISYSEKNSIISTAKKYFKLAYSYINS